MCGTERKIPVDQTHKQTESDGMSVARGSLPLPAMWEGAAVQGVTDRSGCGEAFHHHRADNGQPGAVGSCRAIAAGGAGHDGCDSTAGEGRGQKPRQARFSAAPVAKRACFQDFGDG